MLAQHIMIVACSGPFNPDVLFAEVTSAAPYVGLSRADFDDVLAFVDHGGYALRLMSAGAAPTEGRNLSHPFAGGGTTPAHEYRYHRRSGNLESAHPTGARPGGSGGIFRHGS